MATDKIPFQVDATRVISLLANQIYQSPLALLRENAQNAYDAILMRRQLGDDFEPIVDIRIDARRIVVCDNGIGMTEYEVRNNYWRAGSSGKNTEQAAAAGVVGTFGIGAMANFGIADELTMETEAVDGRDRLRTSAAKDKLSLHEDCVSFHRLPLTGQPGTRVVASIGAGFELDVEAAKLYIKDFVQLSDIAIVANGEVISKRNPLALVPVPPEAWRRADGQCSLGNNLTANVALVVSQNADVWISLDDIRWAGSLIPGTVVLRSGLSTIRTFRSGFGLATVGVHSVYQLGGVVNLRTLQPTAGREALTTDSMRFLQAMVAEVEQFVSEQLGRRPESDSSNHFMSWVLANGRIDLCANLRMNVMPGDRTPLRDIRAKSESKQVHYYGGSSEAVVRNFSSEDSPLLILARQQPRRQCEEAYLSQFCNVDLVSDNPVIEDEKDIRDLTVAERALAFRLESVLDTDYFVKMNVLFGRISHGLPILVDREQGELRLVLDPSGQTVDLILRLYEDEYGAFGSMVKDFARSVVFPRISADVPSSSRQGAEEFLRAIRKPREVFEYEESDLGNLAQVWKDYDEGKISMAQAVHKSVTAVRSGVQVVDSSSARDMGGVVPDVLRNENDIRSSVDAEDYLTLEPCPSISRLEISSGAKMLTLSSDETTLRGYRCFLALTPKVREEIGDFFLQAHRTSIVWGGQRVLYVFLDHSGTYGIYYDLQTNEMLSSESGGGPVPTCTIMLRNSIYIPVPNELVENFVPQPGGKKRFEVRQDILRVSESRT